jgi:uncharacterized cupin superfamily protein
MSGHEHLIHWDDVEAVERAKGELHTRRRRLGAAAHAREIGLSRWEIAPGARSMPVHVHADEEEIFYVLGGSGLSWQDGKTYRVGAGDVLVHRVNEEAHTLIAGDDGLDVLAFAEGSSTNITWLPRAGVFWLGAHWVPPDSPHPFKAEADAGPLEVAEPESERPGTIVNVADVTEDPETQPGYSGVERPATRGIARRSGLRHVTLDPGTLSCPPHWHTCEDECFVVLEGSGQAWLDDERYDVRPGSVLTRPGGTRVAHALEAGPDGLVYLAYGQHRTNEVVYYPRSQKLNINGVKFRVEPLDYWDGE